MIFDPRRRSGRSHALFLTLFFVAVAVAAQDQDLRRDPGFVDFGELPGFRDDQLDVHVSIKGPMLRLVAEATRETEPDLASILDALQGIEVRVYETREDERPAVRGKMRAISEELEKKGWIQALTLRLHQENGYMYLHMAGDQPDGLTAMYIGEDGEAVFVNIVGPLDPAKIGRLAAKFDLDLLAPER